MKYEYKERITKYMVLEMLTSPWRICIQWASYLQNNKSVLHPGFPTVSYKRSCHFLLSKQFTAALEGVSQQSWHLDLIINSQLLLKEMLFPLDKHINEKLPPSESQGKVAVSCTCAWTTGLCPASEAGSRLSSPRVAHCRGQLEECCLYQQVFYY